MSWQNVFKKYHIAEIGKKGKVVTINVEQVSQFSLFPYGNKNEISEKELKDFLAEDMFIFKKVLNKLRTENQDLKIDNEILKKKNSTLIKENQELGELVIKYKLKVMEKIGTVFN